VAADAAEYVRLGIEPDFRAEIERRITEASGVLFKDIGVVGELEQFLLAAAGR
jgi:hypothetical protein